MFFPFGAYVIRAVRDSELDDSPHRVFMDYGIRLGAYDPKRANGSDCRFVSNPAISAKVRQLFESGFRHELDGYVTAKIDTGKKLITTDPHLPIPRAHDKDTALKKVGLGTLVELEIQQDLEKIYPRYNFAIQRKVSKDRRSQTRKRGMYLGVPIPLAKAIKLTAAQALRQRLKNSRPQLPRARRTRR